jgi:PAS domain S-box-containing protein
MTGYGKEELIGNTVLDHFDEDNQKIIKEQFEKRRKGETASYQVESVRKDGSRMVVMISPRPVSDSDGKFQGGFATISDITSKVENEAMFLSEHNIMKKQMKDLINEIEEYNHALKVLLKNGKHEQKKIGENIFSNVRETVAPFIDKLKNTRLSENQKSFLDVIETNLNNIVSPFVSRLKSEMRDFTPMEIQVATLIKEGRENKEISDIMNVSEYTVMFHRKNIREKLGLKHQKMNLRTYLLSLD